MVMIPMRPTMVSLVAGAPPSRGSLDAMLLLYSKFIREGAHEQDQSTCAGIKVLSLWYDRRRVRGRRCKDTVSVSE